MTKHQTEQICRLMVQNAVDAHNQPAYGDFKGAAFFTKEEINSALDEVGKAIDNNQPNVGGRRDLEITNQLHTITCMGTRGAILNYDQAEFVKRWVSLDALWSGVE